MQPYQKEYIANLQYISSLTVRIRPKDQSFDEYYRDMLQNRLEIEKKVKRNMQLLRENLFPVLDQIFETSAEEKDELREFAESLLNVREEIDTGLYCQIYKALLGFSRQMRVRNDAIKALYRLGMGYHSICNKLVSLEYNQVKKYYFQMRLYFTEAAAYLKYYDEIDDAETFGYILRSRANMSLGKFKTVSEKIAMVKRSLMILQDRGYQEKAPDLPWDRFIYMTHQQMAASIAYGKEDAMTPQDVADVMESVYIVYQRRLKEASENNKKLSAKIQLSSFAMEYCCGLHSIEDLLNKMEVLMDSADPSDYSAEGMYEIISLPAFYCQYLNKNPHLISKRTEYIEELYKKILDYIEAFPEASLNESLFLYLRQLSYTFVETEKSISYKDFLQKLQITFTPTIYVHSLAVGFAARSLCGLIVDEEPDFFDDIDFISRIDDISKKKSFILNYALECGILHDVGKINFINLYSNTSRQWFEEEYEMAHLHTMVGKACLEQRNSTACYADIALGHHSWYDGSQGYPDSYNRLDSSFRQMVDVVGLVDWLDNVTETARLYNGLDMTFEEAIQKAVSLEGKRFSPLLTARLRDKNVLGSIKTAFAEGRMQAYKNIYNNNL